MIRVSKFDVSWWTAEELPAAEYSVFSTCSNTDIFIGEYRIHLPQQLNLSDFEPPDLSPILPWEWKNLFNPHQGIYTNRLRAKPKRFKRR